MMKAERQEQILKKQNQLRLMTLNFIFGERGDFFKIIILLV